MWTIDSTLLSKPNLMERSMIVSFGILLVVVLVDSGSYLHRSCNFFVYYSV